MSKTRIIVRLAASAALTIAFTSLARAQTARTWVSGAGDDVNPCSRALPCKTFAGALSKTLGGGEIDVVDPGSYGAVTINKSVTIDGAGSQAGITHTGGSDGIQVDFNAFAAADTLKSVQLRNLSIHGGGSPAAGARGISITGGAVITGGYVSVEHCVIEGQTGSPGRGIEDARIGDGRLFVSDTTIQNLSGTAISHVAPGTSSGVVWTIDRVRIFNCAYGVAVSTGARALVSNSVITGCGNSGLYAEGPMGPSELHAENTVMSNNGTGVRNAGNATMRLSNCTITFNVQAIFGATLSFGNNKIAGNTAAGTTPTAVGPASSNFGQQ